MKNWIKKHKVLFVLIILIVAAGTAAAVLLPGIIGSKSSAPAAAIRQNTISLEKMNLTNSISATGTIESAKSKTVSADVSNITIKSVKVKEGDTVKKGQTLATFDKTDLNRSLSDARENLASAKDQAALDLAQAKRKLSDAQTTYSEQKKTMEERVSSAKKEYTEAKAAAAAATDPQEKEKAQETLKQAKSSYTQAKTDRDSTNRQNLSSVQSAKDSVTTAKSNGSKSIREAENSVENAQTALSKCSLTAPMDGIITASCAEAGAQYSGTALFEISDCSNFQITASVGEYDISKIKKGQKAVILTDASGDTELSGKITHVSLSMGTSLNSGNSGTGTSSMSSGSSSSGSGYDVKIRILDKNDALRIGMTAKCSLILEEAADVYAVPYDAIHESQDGSSVIYVNDNGSRTEISVTKGMESDYYTEISGSGLSEGLQVILPSESVSEKSTESEDDSGGVLDGMIGGGRGDRADGGGGAPGGGGGAPGGGGGAPGGGGGAPGGGPGM